MEIEEKRHGAITVLRPRGPIADPEHTVVLEQARQTMTRTRGRFVIDASDIAFVDSAGLEALLDVTEMLAPSGHVLKLCGTTETVRETLELTGLAGEFEHYEDVQMAVRSFM